MKLYYHKTDGGAEYYSLDHIDGCDEGDVRSAVMRTDGGEIEIFANTLKERGIDLKVQNQTLPKEMAECLDEIQKEALAIGYGNMPKEKQKVYAKSISELVNKIYAMGNDFTDAGARRGVRPFKGGSF